jgi:hypothetical protein
MIKKLFISLLCFFSIACSVYAQEAITGLETKDIPVINEELRKLGHDIRKNQADAAAAIANVANVPSGAIFMWSGSVATIPAGYYLCDGNNGTPDLRGRFVIAAGGTYNPGGTGGGSIPIHYHEFSLGGSGGNNLYTGVNAISNVDAQYGTSRTTSYGTGTEVIAKYYALAYIMKS